MVKDAREGDLPWDPIWAYVLGEDEEDDRKRRRIRFRNKHDVEPHDSSASIMSYILPTAYDETRADSFASDQSVDEDAASREDSEKSAVDLVAGIFSWGSDRRESVEKEEPKKWLPTLPVTQSELSEKSGDSAKASEKSNDSKGPRSFLARSKSDSDLASKAPTSNPALTLTSTAVKLLGSSGVPSFSVGDHVNSSSPHNKKTVSVPLFGSDKTKQKDTRSSAAATLVKEHVSSPCDKPELGAVEKIVRIRGLASAHSGKGDGQPSWDMLGLMSSNETLQSPTRPRQRNHKSTESDISRKKGLRGMMSGKPKAAKDSTNGDTDISKKKDRRGLAMVNSKQNRSERNDSQRSSSHSSTTGGGPTTKRERGFKAISNKKEMPSVPLEDHPNKATNRDAPLRKSETIQQTFLFGQKSREDESSRERHGIVFGRWKKANDTIDQGRRSTKEDSTPEKGIGLSWPFGATSADEEPKKERRIMTFGRSSTKKPGFHVESDGPESKHKSTTQSRHPTNSKDDLPGKPSKTFKSNGDRFRPVTAAAKLLDGKDKDTIEVVVTKRAESHQKHAGIFRKILKGNDGRDSGKVGEKQQNSWFSGGTKESEAIPASSSDTWIWTIDSAIWQTSEKETNTHNVEESPVDKSKRCVRFADTAKPKENALGWQSGRSFIAELQDWAWQSSSSETCEDESPSWRQGPFGGGTNIEDSPEPARDAPESESVLNKIFPLWANTSKAHEETTSSGGSTSESSVTSYSDTTEENVTTQGNEESAPLEIESPNHDYNEVRLVFRPIAGKEDSEDGDETDIRPFVTDQISVNSSSDSVHDFDYQFDLEVTNEIRSTRDIAKVEQGNTWTTQVDGLPSDPFTATNECFGTSLDSSVPSRSQQNWKLCRSVMELNLERQNLSAQSGISFHELSPLEMVTLFPKVKSVSDRKQGLSSDNLKDERAWEDGEASLKANASFAGTQCIYEYEYETGVHMLVSYDKFESPSAKVPLLVAVAPVPRFNGDTSEKIDALVQVEASTVSLTDCFIRQGQWWRKDELTLPNTPGVDFVGKLYRIDVTTSKRLGLSVGDRVMSLVKWGGNTRFLSVDPTSLVKVPETIDPASAVCLVETYLAAFQVLHQGQRGKSRYRMGSLNNKSILIVGNAVTTIGRAICDIAFDGGATRVYALAEQNHNQELVAIGVSPLIGGAERWRPSLVGNVDCIVCLEESIDPALYPLLKPNGQAVLVRFKDFVEETSTPSVNGFSETKSCWKKHLHNKIVAYNIFEEWENNKDLCIKDLQHLVDLLVQTRIAPRVLDRIPLSKVARAQELVASARLSGIMVCEPWLIGKSRTVCL